MVSYCRSFLPALHDVRESLNNLLNSDVPCNFGPNRPIVISAVALNYGIGAAISHSWPNKVEKSIACASHTLTPVKNNHSQIQREAIAIKFANKKFRNYVYG